MDDNLTTLIDRARRGDRRALNELFTRWYPQVYNIAYRYFSDEERAREVSQQTFLQVQQKLGQLREAGGFRVWLYRTVVNFCHNEYRRERDRQRTYEAYGGRQPRPVAAGPEAAYVREERSQQVLAALQQLPEEQRLVIIMKEYEELTFREIADILGISENTAKSRLYYGLKSLRKFFLTKTTMRYE